ncbi:MULTISPECIES: prepilin peptidase-dependent protein [Tenebrionibacter/Tenebrionicola group]|jgi:prepilin peptidase dependent protein A|uniref:Prepilin peptidase-dependent protein n=2 Tax=Tenebrionibacter/Tenebrionicola group TaxID=2969848 RepID=A0A8K0V4I4_9ENTR|nr:MULTISPECIES: prepilin peptidase-dependent protein [Tenebrionibacter/Tenebrionicola group]MBK4714914.1 prepilin peptidase-dependent protein [Tenebrionibacter intestinalis]MBV5095740.1 prepilin peptidase-dependent protein [Tenebrionicola larvae]
MGRKQRGYSLMELMIVLAATAMLSMGGMRGWQKWQQRQRLEQSARSLLVWLQQQRDEANAFNRERVLVVIRNGELWCLSAEAAAASVCHAPSRRIWMPPWPGVTLAEFTPGLTFFGLRNTAWNGHITLENEAGRRRAVISTWGRIRLCRAGEAGCR